MERIRITLNVQKEKFTDFDEYLNEMVWGLRNNAQVDDIVWTGRNELIIALSVEDRDEKWAVLSELLTWVYCEQYGDNIDITEVKCDAL